MTVESLVSFVLFLPCFYSGQINLAFKKSTQLSKVMFDGFPAKAVDGDYENDLFSASGCAYAEGQFVLPYTWWAVDLGDEYDISNVIIYRRGGPYNLVGLYVELSSGSPFLCGGSGVKTCAIINQQVADPYENFTCDPGAKCRFLTIRRHVNDFEGLCLCEVEVYGEIASASAAGEKARNCSGTIKMAKQVNFGISGYAVRQGESVTRVGCSIECMREGACVAYSFNPGLNQCQYASGGFKKIQIVASVGWETYTYC